MALFPIVSGIIASSLHVVSGPDHLAAVTPIAIEEDKAVWRIGLFWGLGHIAGMLIIGILVFFFKDLIPFESISAFSEQIVGVVLILMGIWVLKEIFLKNKKHKHPHIHLEDGEHYVHKHKHIHSDKKSHEHTHNGRARKQLPFGIGFIHGLAGISHLILLLPVLSFESRVESFAYLGGFGIGSIGAMVLYTVVLGLITRFIEFNKRPIAGSTFRVLAAMFALVVGVYWVMG